MAGEYSRFFGGPVGSVPEYTQPQFAEVLSKIFTDGVFTDIDNELEVVETDPVALAVRVNTGEAWIQGFWYQNTAYLTKSLAAADPDNDRIDRIVLRLDTVTNFKISIEVLTGTPAGSPTAPALTQTASTYEISLVQVLVGATETSVSDVEITDERTYSAVTGAATVAYVDANSGGLWKNSPATMTRTGNATITIPDAANANKYDLQFKKGSLITWTEGGTYKLGMVITSSYGANVVTLTIIGDTCGATATAFKYCINKAMIETFIIPGNLAVVADTAKTWYTPYPLCVISADFKVKTAPSGANATTVDINDDGTTMFTTKPTLAAAETSDIDNVSDNVETVVAQGSLITVDVDAVCATTPGTEAYVYIYFMPESWRYEV